MLRAILYSFAMSLPATTDASSRRHAQHRPIRDDSCRVAGSVLTREGDTTSLVRTLVAGTQLRARASQYGRGRESKKVSLSLRPSIPSEVLDYG